MDPQYTENPNVWQPGGPWTEGRDAAVAVNEPAVQHTTSVAVDVPDAPVGMSANIAIPTHGVDY